MNPLDGNNYFDQMKAKYIEDKNCYWLCLGNVSRTEEIRNAADVSNNRNNNNRGRQYTRIKFTPSTQLRL